MRMSRRPRGCNFLTEWAGEPPCEPSAFMARTESRPPRTCIVRVALRNAALVGAVAAVTLGTLAHARADDLDTKYRLNLADLRGYRAALNGKPTTDSAKASDTPVQVRFRDLWNEPNTFLGRRVVVHGRVERIFRQPAVGQFPPLAEVWIMSPAGDPFCIVFAQHESTTEAGQQERKNHGGVKSDSRKPQDTPRSIPNVGQTVRFTGTFLKMVSYAASDGKRLAPLIVGERQPRDEPDGPEISGGAALRATSADVLQSIGSRESRSQRGRSPWWGANGVLALAMAAVAAGIITWQHVRTRSQHRREARHDQDLPKSGDPPLEFIN